jgi:holliday junction DNA helicase RuvA
MFAHITGTIISLDGAKATISINGIGLALDVLISGSVLSEGHIGSTLSIPLHHHITEAGQSLFGFASDHERGIFRKLLGVNGVGGKTAMNILSLGTENIMRAIELQDDTLLSSVPGIGKKTAQKIIVDLKGSIDFSRLNSGEKTAQNKNDTTLISSLVGMGYDKSHVEEIVASLAKGDSLEIRTIEAIRKLAKN